jgi:mRNA interferase MazF
MGKILKAGEIYYLNLDPTVGDEIKKKLPVVVLNGGHVKHLRLAIVVPVTNWNITWTDNPFFVRLDPTQQNGLTKSSTIDCYQVRAVSHERFLDKLGAVTEADLDSVKKSLTLILDIDPEHCII